MKRKILKMCILGLLSTFVFSTCKSDDENLKDKKNQAPSKVKLEEPADEFKKTSVVPTFKWLESKDPEKGEVVYDLYLSKDKTFPENSTKKAVGLKINQFTFSNYELERMTTYYWKVIAYDKEKQSSSSDVSSFTTVDVVISLSLLTPQDSAIITNNSPEITWDTKINTLHTDAVTYSIYIRNGSDLFSTPLKTGITETKYTLSNLKGNGKYYWAIAIMDKDGNELTKSNTFHFTTPNTIPTAPVLNSSTLEEETTTGIDTTIKWQAATDVDRILENGKLRDEKLTYDIYLSNDNIFEATDLKQATLTDLKFKFTGLTFNTDYWSKIVVKDENGGVVDSNTIQFKTKEKTVTGTINTSIGTVSLNGKQYKTVTINGTTWLAENYAHIPYLEKNDTNGNKMICSVYGEDNPIDITTLKGTANYTEYGVLYSGYAIADTTDLIPVGWHVATDDEWKILEKLSGLTDIQTNNTGYQLGKRGITMHKFIEESQPFTITSALEPTNEMKTSLKYGGYLKSNYSGKTFKGIATYTYFWTGTEKANNFGGGNSLYYRAFSSTRKGIERNLKGHTQRMYIRLVKD